MIDRPPPPGPPPAAAPPPPPARPGQTAQPGHLSPGEQTSRAGQTGQPGSLHAELSPPSVQLEPGGPPVEATLALQNQGDLVEQYAVELLGLDPAWYRQSVSSVGLFPRDRDVVRFTLRAPAGPGARPALYPFRVVVRDGRGQETVLDATVDVRGTAAFTLHLEPGQRTGRLGGRFKLRLANTGPLDLRLAVEAGCFDDAGSWRLRLPGGPPPAEITVPAGKDATLPLGVTPITGRWVGPPRIVHLSVAARPLDARGDPLSAGAGYTHRPLLSSWGALLAPLRWVGRLLRAMFRGLAGAVQRFGWRSILMGASVPLVLGALIFGPALPMLNGGLRLAGGALGHNVPGIPRPSGLPWFGPRPPSAPACALDERFAGLAPDQQPFVGACATAAVADRSGNVVRQSTTRGVFFWQRETKSVYFFTGDSVYLLVDGRFTPIHGPALH